MNYEQPTLQFRQVKHIDCGNIYYKVQQLWNVQNGESYWAGEPRNTSDICIEAELSISLWVPSRQEWRDLPEVTDDSKYS